MQTLRDMFVEPTAHSLIDSGSIYGRNYQKNAERDLDAEPSAILNRFGVTVNIYQCLKRLLDEDRFCQEFNAMSCTDWDGEHWGTSATQQMWLEDRCFEAQGEPINTYNYETNFDQVVQYQRLERDDEIYILLQVHGGCDVRSGYTDAKLFHLDSWQADYFLRDDADFYLEAGQAPNPNDFPISISTYGSHADAYDDDGNSIEFTMGHLPDDLNVTGTAQAVEH